MSHEAPVLTAEQITYHVTTGEGDLRILDDVSLSIYPQERVAIVGRSGSGKSTLLGVLAGLDQPSSGRVTLLGHPLDGLDEDERARLRQRRVGFVFQSFQLLEDMTALMNVALPLKLAGQDKAESRAAEWLERVGLGDRLHHYPAQLSGGEQQRVAIARAFITSPTLIFADEPTGNLDDTTGQHVIDLLFALNRDEGVTLVLVTHDPVLADACDRRLTLEKGRLVEGGGAH